MSSRNNKKSGTEFENEFRRILKQNGFWSHKLVENENGAPFDVIAVKNERVYAFDCKDCSSDRFPFKRVEDNQIVGMRSIRRAGAEAYFVFRLDRSGYIISFDRLFDFMRTGLKSMKVTECPTLEGWLLCH